MQHSETVINMEYAGFNPMQFGWESCRPCHDFGPAVREHWLLHYVVSGFGTFIREGVTYNLGPGEIFIIPPYLETYYIADREKPWSYIWIGFTTENELSEIFKQPELRHPGVNKIFEAMRECTKYENGKSAYLAGCLWQLNALLLEEDEKKADYCDKALAIMHSEYANGITVADIAERLGLDRGYFSTLFRSKTGTPPIQYLLNLRLQRAAELMTVHGEPPATAALSVGYTDIYHFSKIFKKHFGVSPREYKYNNL